MPAISAIVCTYTEARWDDLLAAVASLGRQTLPPCEIIVVVDHNSALLARVRAELGDVAARPNVEARGLAGARNSGVRVAQGDIVAFLDDDAIAAPDWLARLAAAYDDERVAGAGGAVEPLWEDGRPAWLPEEFDWVLGCSYRGLPQRAAAVRNLFGGAMSLRREAFEAAGGFRHRLGRVGSGAAGCEETELCVRIQQRRPGCVFLFQPSARIYHRVPAARARWAYFRARTYGEGLSKAQVTAAVGANDGLSVEWQYVLRTLPRGVARGLAGALRGEGPAGVARAAAIVAGLALTVAGYTVGTGRRLLWNARV
ncbi:MAG TPA: glycosyltransferase [Anaerolineae bacterium]|nr:glycosyltransferase [Anaerolineae bacterium]HOQ98680.1 glycosyltransferase [Anaerolineae bacterium]HPL26659.1 glycosyltransferase [Anaerolineae bacterium]